MIKSGPFEDVKELTESKFSMTDHKDDEEESNSDDSFFSEISVDTLGSKKAIKSGTPKTKEGNMRYK